jgi:hypothetical protein
VKATLILVGNNAKTKKIMGKTKAVDANLYVIAIEII